MIRLGINIDHVATLRNARGENHPNLYQVAKYIMKLGANSITIHLREDRRHIKDNDLKILSKDNKIPLNLEICSNKKMLSMALKYKPNYVCVVPEKRNEVTTEGGLNLTKNKKKIKTLVSLLKKKKIRTSLFINPNITDIKVSRYVNADCIEIHTGKISRLIKSKKNFIKEFNNIKKCSKYAKSIGLEVHAGHGMDYKTTEILSKIKEIKEFNIGHFIIGESINFGLKKVLNKIKKITNSK
tara:strand:- start:1670 stop:2392 length:723 start_codon:yes stop_codon:yes gene_type:complete